MNIRIAIFAACASTLALTQADVGRANDSPTAESKGGEKMIAEGGPEPVIVLAFKVPENNSPIPMNRSSATKSKEKTATKGGTQSNEQQRLPRPGALKDCDTPRLQCLDNCNYGLSSHSVQWSMGCRSICNQIWRNCLAKG